MPAILRRAQSLMALLAILVLALVLFGGKKVGELGKGLGEGIRNFKTALKEEEHKDDEKK